MWMSFTGFSHETKKGPDLRRGRSLFFFFFQRVTPTLPTFITCQFTAAWALCASFSGEDAGITRGVKVACSISTNCNGFDRKGGVFIFNCEFSWIEDLWQVWAAHWEIPQPRGGTVALPRCCLCARRLFFWNSPSGALLTDWQAAGERYDGAVRPAVWLSAGTGSPDALRKASECNFPSHPSKNFFFPPTGSAAPFIFRDRPGKRNDDGNTWPQSLQKSTLAKCASAGERDQTFGCQGRK